MDRDDILMREYETITPQVIHWDTFAWSKSQFFLAIEALFLAGTADAILERATGPAILGTKAMALFCGLVAFHVFLCFVWFRSNRSNREYLVIRFDRAREIEAEVGGGSVVDLFHRQQRFLQDKSRQKHGASQWEESIPVGFAIAWCILLTISTFSASNGDRIWPVLLIVAEVVLFLSIERFGWLVVPRSTAEATKSDDADKNDKSVITKDEVPEPTGKSGSGAA